MKSLRHATLRSVGRLSTVHRRVLLCAGAVLLAGGGMLWRYAVQENTRAEVHPARGVVLTLAKNAKGEVIATLLNDTREPKEFFTEPQRLEVFEDGTWQLPPTRFVRCGLENVRHEKLAAGKEVTFRIQQNLNRVKPGQKFRVIIYADGEFKSGVASNALVLAPAPKPDPRG